MKGIGKRTRSTHTEDDSSSNEIELDTEVIQERIQDIADIGSSVLRTKRDLLMVYLINLELYKSLEEKEFSPIKSTLMKISILLEKIQFIEDKESVKEEERREAPKYIIENKGIRKHRKKEESNPRVKNRRKATDMFKRGKINPDKNISDKKTKTSKFN